MGRSQGLGAYAVLFVLMPLLTSCSRATPLCGYADGLTKAAELTAAADAYAAAQRSDEGDCAKDGLDKVSKLQASAKVEDAKGRAAAQAGDIEAAKAHFRAALNIDRSDDVAAAELQRLGAATPTPAPVVSPLIVQAPATRSTASSGLSWAALAVAVSALGASVGLWLYYRRRAEAVEIASRNARTQLGTVWTQVDALNVKLAELATTFAEKTSISHDRAIELRRMIDDLRSGMLRLIRSSLTASSDPAITDVEEEYVPKPRQPR